MEEDSSGLPARIRVQENNLRYLQSVIQAQLEYFEKEIPESTFLESSVCDNVKNQILYSDDEPYLSEVQNNCRRIFIASELFIGICSIYSHIVDYEFTQIISDIVQWEKFRKLSRQISHKIHIEAKREKYFAKEAQAKLLKSLEGAENSRVEGVVCGDILRPYSDYSESTEHMPRPAEDTEHMLRSMDDVVQMSRPEDDIERFVKSTETELVARYEKESSVVSSKYDLTEAARKESSAQVINETLALPLESSFREDSVSSIIGKLTEMRVEPSMDTFKLQPPISTTPKQDFLLPNTLAEILVGESNIQQKTDDEINKILQILEEQIFQKDLGEIEQPEHTLEPIYKTKEIPKDVTVEELPTEGEEHGDVAEKSGSEEWSLPSLEPIESHRRRRGRLIMDEVTIIPDYATRALQLNRNITIERVQVYEGPPRVLQAISAEHLMTTPGYKSSLFQGGRSAKLNKLYIRHLEVEKKPVERVVLQRRTIEKQRMIDISKEKSKIDIEERVGLRSLFEKSDILTEKAPEKSHLEDLAIGVHTEENIIGMPTSRVINATIEPPAVAQMEKINGAPILPSPRTTTLQGKSLDPKTTEPWFLSTKESPPDPKYREFNYVYKKLQNYWSLFESQGMEKCITLREFFSFEQDESVSNFLTVLRVVDKMSIQRKLVLEYKNPDVLVRPFESPYVSDRQLLLKGKDPIF